MKEALGMEFIPNQDWYFEENFNAIKNFRKTERNKSTNNNEPDGYIGVSVQKYEIEPTDSQINALNYFNDNQSKIIHALANGVIEYYPKILKKYDLETYDEDFDFPELIDIEDVKKHIEIQTLHILHDEKENCSYFGFGCYCPWDIEHGLGIIMYKETVIDVDSADISFCGSEELRKHNGTYTEEERIRDEEWKKQIAENIANYKKEIEGKEAEEPQEKEGKSWWKFWKK